MSRYRLEKSLSLLEQQLKVINCVGKNYWGGGKFFLGLMVGFLEKIGPVMNFDKGFLIGN